MPQLVWDKVGERIYETGLDKGVLYLPDGSAVPWNGLTSIIESFNKESSPVYYDGMKINDLIILGDFAATMKAVTYPDEFVEVEGLGAEDSPARHGLFYADQMPQTFGLCYRTQINGDPDGDIIGYKIHILYNVTAIPSDKTYASHNADPSLIEFEWNITAVPEEVPGFRPTAHIIIDSREFDPLLLEDLESMFYGDTFAVAALLPMADLITYIRAWYRIKIVDNLDGTWTATADRDFIHIHTDLWFEIIGANVVYLDDVTFVISDTLDISDIPDLKIVNNGNGTWTASTSHDGIIVPTGDPTIVEIRNADIVVLNETTYKISDTNET